MNSLKAYHQLPGLDHGSAMGTLTKIQIESVKANTCKCLQLKVYACYERYEPSSAMGQWDLQAVRD